LGEGDGESLNSDLFMRWGGGDGGESLNNDLFMRCCGGESLLRIGGSGSGGDGDDGGESLNSGLFNGSIFSLDGGGDDFFFLLFSTFGGSYPMFFFFDSDAGSIRFKTIPGLHIVTSL